MKNGKLLIMSTLLITACFGATSCSNNDGLVNIGILQYATHDALTLCKEGFIEALSEAGFEDGKNIKITVENPEGTNSTMSSMARNLVISNDLLFGIATPAALSLKTSLKDYNKETPLFFTAVTDPIDAGLCASFTDHGNVTGTSDAGPTAKNIALFKEFGINKIGILWNTAEKNSQIQKEETEQACKELGIELVDGGITSSTQISSKLNGLVASGVKGIFVPTDNMVAGAIESIKEVCIQNKIVSVCADGLVTDKGGSLGFTVDYKVLGTTTGKMAARVLSKETNIDKIDVSLADYFPLSINEEFFEKTGIEIPDSIKDLKENN